MLGYLVLSTLAAFAGPDFDRGNALLNAGDPVGAETAFRAALDDDPADPDAQAQLALALYEQRRYDEALALLNTLLDAHPQHLAGRWYLGVVHFGNGDDGQAAEAFREFRGRIDAQSPQWLAVHWFLAKCDYHLLRTKGISQAETDELVSSIDIYVKGDPQADDAESLRAIAALVRQSRPPRSVARWQASDTADVPPSPGALVLNVREPQPRRTKAPRRYKWVTSENEQSRFLLPKGWHFKREQAGLTQALFLTIERIGPPTMRYETGVSINIIANASVRTGSESASAFITLFAANAQKAEGGALFQIRDPSRTIYELSGAIQRSPEHPDLSKHYLLLADDEADIAVLAFFETPSSAYETNWPIAKPILSTAYFHVWDDKPTHDSGR